MQQARYMLALDHWLTANKGFDPVPKTGGDLAPILHGNVYYRLQGNSLVLLKIFQHVPSDVNAFIDQEFATLEDFRAGKGLQFVTEIALFILEGPLNGVVEELRREKRVSAINRCYFLPWVLDLSQNSLVTHQGLPYDQFGLMGKDSLLVNPLLAEEAERVIPPQTEDAATGSSEPSESVAVEPESQAERPRV
ncbi:MAG TPA: hypothetical protein VNU93_01405, partial [Verrucomicrobiae bacterium]|nr:hypothetical protein [Verrucomicrobiae bacterium]